MLSLLSITNVRAEEFSWNLATNSYSSSSTTSVVWSNANATMTLSKGNSSTKANNYLGGGGNSHTRMYASQVLTFEPATGISITKVEITATSATYASNFTNATWSNATGSTSSSVSTITPTDGTTSFSGTIGTATRATSVKVYYSSGGGSTVQPSITTQPQGAVYVVGATPTALSVVAEAGGGGTLSYQWYSNTSSSTEGATKVGTNSASYTPSTATAGTIYYYCVVSETGADAPTQSDIVAVTVNNPTGTFELFSGDLEEGDYVVVVDGIAMTNTVASNRLANTDVTISSNKISDPPTSIIWHLAPSSSYWTFYNDEVEKYAASTGTKNQATLATTEDAKIMWTVEESNGVYHFNNRHNSDPSVNVNSKLQRNSTYGWACYAAYSDIQLYKKSDGKPSAPSFSPASGKYLETQSVTLTTSTEGATIHYTLDGTTPTSESATYSTALNISTTTTIKAIAIKDDVSSSVASATYEIVTPQSVDEIWNEITASGPTDAYVWGYVSQTSIAGYANNFYISVDGSVNSNQLYAYRMNMNEFTVAIGDRVLLNGDLTIYNDVKEFKYTSADKCGKVISLEAKGALQSVAVSGALIKDAYTAQDNIFDPDGLVVTATYANGYSSVVTEGITWGDDLTNHEVTASGTVNVTATVGGVTSAPYPVTVEFTEKTLSSIALSADEFEVYQGLDLPKPIVTATYSDASQADVTALATFSGYDASTTGEQQITVTYSFGGVEDSKTYTVTVNPIYNVELAASVARELIVQVVGSTGSGENQMIIRGKVSRANNPSGGKQSYYISDDGTASNEVEAYKGWYFDGDSFDDKNKLKVGDEVVVKGSVVYYNSQTPEFADGSVLQSLARIPTFTIADVAELEIGVADLAVADLAVNKNSDGAVTLTSSDNTDYVTIVDGKLHAVAAGTATITANLAADGIYKTATTTFSVTVIPAKVKYAITFDSNGADGGDAPEAIADKAEGAEVTLPENTWTKTGNTFTGWKVINNTTSEEVEVTAGVFIMPSSAVTIQAQWAEISPWATIYTSNVTLTAGTNAQNAKVVISETEYDAIKVGTGKAGGDVKVTVPAQATKLHLHAAGWTGENPTISITAPIGVTVSPASIFASADAGVSSNSPFTLANDPIGQYFALSISGNTEEIELTFAVNGGNKRFVLYGVNQEGGVLPVLDHIEISGDLDTKSGYKEGDNLDLTGLTVMATYTLGGTPQAPVDVTADVQWSYDALVANQEKVTITATYEEKTDDIEITLDEPVAPADPMIYVQPSLNINFGAVEPSAIVEPQVITVTLQNVANATATLGGTNPEVFSINKTALVNGDQIAISVVSTAELGEYSATITISDDAEAAEAKVVNLSLSIENVETPISTASRWEVATASDIADGLEVLITGVKGENTYAMGSQANNNRNAVKASISEGVLAPGEGTMSFILVAQGEGKYALRTSNGKYLYAASNSSNHLKTEDELDKNGNGLWAITYNDDVVSIVAQGTNSHKILRFNENNSIFSCYASGQSPVQLYKKAPIAPAVVDVTSSEVVSNIPEGSEVTVKDGGELTVDTKNSFAKLIVKEGGKVTLSNKKLTVTGTFAIETTMASGKSGELSGVNGSNFAVTGEAYIDITLGDNGNADKWHAFTVPFPVDALNGIFDLDGNKLTNEQNYAIMDYHGDIRAQGKYGWKKFRGTLVPGTFYLMTVDGLRTTYRMKMKAGSNVVADNSKYVYEYAASGEGQSTDAGWNGIGNPTLAYGQVNVAVQVLDPVNYVYETKNANSCNFIVGTPFFYQAAIGGEITIMGEDNEKPYYAPIRKAVKTTEQIKVSLANENYTDNLFISASEDATADYQVGKDLVKMTMTNTPIVPQIFGVAYKTQLSMVHAPLVGDRASYTLNLYAPADGEYTISAQQTEDAIVYLTYEGSPIWNITAGEYNCDLQKGNNSGFGLMLVRRDPQVTTDIEGANQSQNGVRKLLINGQLFIEKEGKLFNVTGQRL